MQLPPLADQKIVHLLQPFHDISHWSQMAKMTWIESRGASSPLALQSYVTTVFLSTSITMYSQRSRFLTGTNQHVVNEGTSIF